ncbi:hypothetical protein EDD22DRAFT_845637 [Suillus occidentalis]|nr:hypothetical protein EDD22DRAFT_845637 [Suillus occidentalis]
MNCLLHQHERHRLQMRMFMELWHPIVKQWQDIHCIALCLTYDMAAVLSVTHTLPTICNQLMWGELIRDSLMGSEWVNMYTQTRKLLHGGMASLPPCQKYGGPSEPHVFFHNLPPVMTFEDVFDSPPSLLPSTSFLLPTTSGHAKYQLHGIIYQGGFPFAARMLHANGAVRQYDGQLNGGHPSLENPASPDPTIIGWLTCSFTCCANVNEGAEREGVSESSASAHTTSVMGFQKGTSGAHVFVRPSLQMQDRFNNIIGRFTGIHRPRFHQVLHQMRGIIVGSCALQMLLGWGETAAAGLGLRDLNIIVPHTSLMLIERFIVNTMGFQSMAATLHPTLTMHMHDFRRYAGNGHIMMVSEARLGVDIVEVVLNGPSTADMTFMSCGGLTMFYPELTLNLTGVRSQNGQKIGHGQSFGSVGKTHFQIWQHTSFLNRACDSSYPALWQRVADNSNCLTIEWDICYEFKSFLLDNNTEWRLDIDCLNERCKFHLPTTFANEDVPPLIMPKDHVDIEYLAHAITEHHPPYSQIYQGLLYVTACTRPYLVPMPVQDGVTASHTLQDLEYNALLNFLVPLDDVYTFFYEDETNNPPPNSLVNNIAPHAPMQAQLDGNLLVVKEHGGLLVDILEDDVRLITFLLKSTQLYITLSVVK